MFHCMSEIGSGGQDTVAWVSWPPTPDFCFWNYKKLSYMSKKCSDIFESNCFLTKLLYFIGHSSMFHCMSRIEGGSQDTQATVSWPPSQNFVFEITRNLVMSPRKEMLRYFRIKLFPNITTFFIGHNYMFHCMSEIEGGGQDTLAW